MYEAHFGLTSRPFGSKAEGSAVFSGPRQVETMTAIKKGLTARDAVVTVTGPVGVGKTSIVGRALDTISPNRMAAWLGRMPLGRDEVLQLLLAGFGVNAQSKGTLQRFAVFRRMLAERAAGGAPVVIVVEDAERIGADVLIELEALTAADAADGTSANILLLGQPGLKTLLAKPELARLKQRTRLRESVEPLSQAEVNGYLKHCIRVAGGDYDELFESGVAEIVFACSEGIPRIINTLCESAMTAAMEERLSTVTAALMHKVAINAFGYEGPIPDALPDLPTEESVEVPILEVKVDSAADHSANDSNAEFDWETPPAAEDDAVPDANEAESRDETAAAEPEVSSAADGDAEPTTEVAGSAVEPADPEPVVPSAARDIIVESGRYPELPEIPEDSPLATNIEEPAVDAEAANDAESCEAADVAAAVTAIPELFDDTQPELTVLQSDPDDAPVADSLEADVESTAIQEQLSETALEALSATSDTDSSSNRDDAESGCEENARNESVADTVADSDADSPDPEDADAELTFETESTNIMEGITTNIDKAAGTADDGEDESAAHETSVPPSLEDIPTLTDSMKVEVEKGVEKDELPTTEPTSELAAATNPLDDADDNSSPVEQAQNAVAETAVPNDETDASALQSECIADSQEEQAALAAALTPDLDAIDEKPSSKPIAQVSEMTARIAALDPENRKDDVESLEAALDAAKKSSLDDLMAPPAVPEEPATETAAPADSASAEAATAAPIPEITLDDQIAQKQAEVDARRKEFAAEIGKANSLEEFSDAMAETLFGDEDFAAIAAEVTANPPILAADGTPAEKDAEEPSPVALSLDEEPEEPSPVALSLDEEPEEPSPVALSLDEEPEEPSPVALSLEEDPVAAESLAEPEVVTEAPPVPGNGELRQSQLMRADMLKSLSANSAPAAATKRPRPEPPPSINDKPAEVPPAAQAPTAAQNVSQPDSIEDQINTSMTQTLEALNVAKMAEAVADPDEEEAPRKKGGLFSRFRKSS